MSVLWNNYDFNKAWFRLFGIVQRIRHWRAQYTYLYFILFIWIFFLFKEAYYAHRISLRIACNHLHHLYSTEERMTVTYYPQIATARTFKFLKLLLRYVRFFLWIYFIIFLLMDFLLHFLFFRADTNFWGIGSTKEYLLWQKFRGPERDSRTPWHFQKFVAKSTENNYF